jgi:S1-C subfamily serine protease
VDPSGPAAEAGLQRADIIHEVNRKSVENIEQFRNVLDEIPKGANALLRIERVRRGQSSFLYVSVTLE